MSSVTNSSVAPGNGHVVPILPLALLEAVRTHDRPVEVLEDEDLTVSLPRRLGLSDVVLSQIRRYEAEVAAGRRVPMPELVDLLRLVLRRPDAAEILMDAGRDVARTRFKRVPDWLVKFYRATPRRLALVGVRRATDRFLRTIAGATRITLRKPLVVEFKDSPTGRLDVTACVLYTGAIEEIARLYLGTDQRVIHSLCNARGDAVCEWMLEG